LWKPEEKRKRVPGKVMGGEKASHMEKKTAESEGTTSPLPVERGTKFLPGKRKKKGDTAVT